MEFVELHSDSASPRKDLVGRLSAQEVLTLGPAELVAAVAAAAVVARAAVDCRVQGWSFYRKHLAVAGHTQIVNSWSAAAAVVVAAVVAVVVAAAAAAAVVVAEKD